MRRDWHVAQAVCILNSSTCLVVTEYFQIGFFNELFRGKSARNY
jgi:hypothetical protein